MTLSKTYFAALAPEQHKEFLSSLPNKYCLTQSLLTSVLAREKMFSAGHGSGLSSHILLRNFSLEIKLQSVKPKSSKYAINLTTKCLNLYLVVDNTEGINAIEEGLASRVMVGNPENLEQMNVLYYGEMHNR